MFTEGLRRPWRISFPKLHCYCWRQRVAFTRGRANTNCRNTHPSTGMLLIWLGHGGTDRQQAETITAWGRDELPCWSLLEASLAPQPSPDRAGGGQHWGWAQLVINKHSAQTGHLLPSLQQNHKRSREMQPQGLQFEHSTPSLTRLVMPSQAIQRLLHICTYFSCLLGVVLTFVFPPTVVLL